MASTRGRCEAGSRGAIKEGPRREKRKRVREGEEKRTQFLTKRERGGLLQGKSAKRQCRRQTFYKGREKNNTME